MLKKYFKPLFALIIMTVLSSCNNAVPVVTGILATQTEKTAEQVKPVNSPTPEQKFTDFSGNPEKKISLKIKLDKNLFLKNSEVNFTLYDDKEYSGPYCPGFNPDVEKEPKPCVDKQGEKYSFDMAETGDEILITSQNLEKGGSYHLEIEGKANDDCQTIYADIKGEIAGNQVEIANPELQYQGGKCLGGQILDENGNKINQPVNIYILYTNYPFSELKTDNGEYREDGLYGNIEILAGADGYLTRREMLDLSDISLKHNIVLKKNNQEPRTMNLKFDKNGVSKRIRIEVKMSVTGREEIFYLDPSTNDNIETVKLNGLRPGDLYKISSSGQAEKSCNPVYNQGIGIITSDGMYPLRDAIPASTYFFSNDDFVCPNISEITGKITDKEGNPVKDVLVKISPAEKASPGAIHWEEETSAADGTYHLYNIPPSYLTISVEKQGWKTVKRTEQLSNISGGADGYPDPYKVLAIDFTGNYAMQEEE
jgi:hypothetical protein